MPAPGAENHPLTLNARLDEEVADFLLDRQARNLSARTIEWYTRALVIWRAFLAEQAVLATEQLTPSHLRRFLLMLRERGHNAGGVSNVFRAVAAYLRWYESEYAPAGWSNPLRKLKMPRVPTEPLAPVELETVRAMLATCVPRTLTGERDRALLLVLLDTGLRHQEVTDLAVGDVDMQTGAVMVRSGKGRKPRVVFVGARTRRALLAYLRLRRVVTPEDPLWITQTGGRLSRSGIRQVVRRRAEAAGVDEPGMHALRRAFAINSLRSGMDVVTLQRLLGHTTLAVVQRYLRLVDDDLRAAHARHGAVDRLL